MKIARILCRLSAPLAVLTAEIWLACAASMIPTPAGAQFWDYPFWGRRPGSPQREWSPWRDSRPQPPADASKAPSPRKQEGAPTNTVLVLGDSMADWLGFGLEDAFAETPEMGVVRKSRTYTGLIRPESRKEFDWPVGAKEILAAEKADFIVMMIGPNDRQSLRERPVKPAAKQPVAPATKLEGAQPTPINPQPSESKESTAEPDAEKGAEEHKSGDAHKPAAAAEPAGPMMTYEFRSEKWGEAYGRRIDEMIAVLKTKGVPVLWVGLPAVRGTRSTSDIAYLNELYRGHSEKAGIVYVDVWDGFVDENGNFAPRGPDFEGQIRQLRAGDGTNFTKAGARKLAHYVEREIRRLMLSRGAPMALPAPEEPPDASRPAGSPAARPAAGPVVPLAASASTQEGLLGVGAQRGAMPDPNVNRVLIRGEPLTSINGRADDFAWPRPEANLPPEPEPPAAPASGPTKPGTASPGSPKSTPARRNLPAAASEGGRRSTSLGEGQPREPARRRAPADNALRPPGLVPGAGLPTRGGW
jgi:uncharacterized protein